MKPSRTRQRAGRWLVAVCCAAPLTAAAQALPQPAAPAVEAGLALEDVLRITLRDNPNIQVAARDVDIDRGALVAAGDPFDAKLRTAVDSTRFNTLRPDPTGYSWLDTNHTQYTVGVQKQLRRGVIVTPELGVSRTALPALPVEPTSQATAKLSVLVPLLKDRDGVVTSAPERAARHAYEAGKFHTQHVAAQAILTAVTAYWDYEMATARLAVLTASEARARRLLDDTRRLVEAGERPPSDLTQVQGNLAAKRVTRISAEQAVVDTRVRLGLAMGLDPAETAALAPATTPFPPVDAAAAGAIAMPPLVADALGNRADLRATEKTVQSARVMAGAARDNLKPRIDLVASIGYAGLQVGGGSISSLFSSVYRNVPGPDLSVSFRYEWATSNVGAQGRLLQSESAYEEQRITEQELQRQIRTGVYQASQSIARNASGAAEAHEAVRLYEATVHSEERKFQVGLSSLFDVIQAAEALTSVTLSEISAQREYAVALAALRFQTGSLVAADSPTATVDVGRLLALR